MKIFILFWCFSFFQYSYAKFPTVSIKNIKGEYMDEKGSAYADSAKYILPNINLSHTKFKVDISKKNKSLIIRDLNTVLELGFDFSFMNVLKSFSFEDANFFSDETVLESEGKKIDITISPRKYFIRDFKMKADISSHPRQEDQDITILDGIIFNTDISVKRISFGNVGNRFLDILSDFNFKYNKAIPMTLRSIKVNINDGVFKVSGLVDSYLNLWARLYGKIQKLPNEDVLEIDLISARLGFFSIKKRVLRSVRELNLESVKVKGSKIIIDYSGTILTL